MSRSERRLKKRHYLQTIAALAGVGIFLYIPFAFFYTFANPILFVNEDPATEVFIDGSLVKFEKTYFNLYPWKWGYGVEIKGPLGTQRRIIYPWDQESDSGSVIVRKNEVNFYIKSEPWNE